MEITNSLLGKTVLVTGGTGFMGKLLVRKLLDRGAEYVISYSRRWDDSEKMAREIDDSRLVMVNGDVRDKTAVMDVFRKYTPDSVIHCAAYKSVPSAQRNPREVISVNLDGTMIVADCAEATGTMEFCLISTDKACAPANTYGKSKALAEDYVSAKATNSGLWQRPKFFSVRYGNVVGSTGSVFEVFKNATSYKITDPNMTRYWFRKNSAADFVLDSFDRAIGGEVFVPYLSSSTMQEFLDAYTAVFEKPSLIVGRREREKTHEMMISENEIDLTVWYENEKVFAILPDGETRGGATPARAVVKDKEFTSNNTNRYTPEELQKLIKEYLYE